MAHCCIFNVLGQGPRVQRWKNVGICDSSGCGDDSLLTAHGRWRATWIELAAADRAVAYQEVSV